mmetsp:Transcript_4131/g.5406  ORF Transcript_4131/g.5406 Transcript_4131/m.5406 type:complete len:167 (-) Transcript_4131:361-861(-)
MLSKLLKISYFVIIALVASCSSESPKQVFQKSCRVPCPSSIFVPFNTEESLLPSSSSTDIISSATGRSSVSQTIGIPRGGVWFPAGYHPYGYGLTELGLEFLKFEGSLDSDIGRFLASLKTGRKKQKVLKEQWLEVVRVSKTGQSMRILRTLDNLIEFCIKVGFIN